MSLSLWNCVSESHLLGAEGGVDKHPDEYEENLMRYICMTCSGVDDKQVLLMSKMKIYGLGTHTSCSQQGEQSDGFRSHDDWLVPKRCTQHFHLKVDISDVLSHFPHLSTLSFTPSYLPSSDHKRYALWWIPSHWTRQQPASGTQERTKRGKALQIRVSYFECNY